MSEASDRYCAFDIHSRPFGEHFRAVYANRTGVTEMMPTDFVERLFQCTSFGTLEQLEAKLNSNNKVIARIMRPLMEEISCTCR